MELGVFLRGVGLAAGGAVFWLMYFDLKDRLQPEPRRHLVSAFVLGAIAAVVSLVLYEFLESAGIREPLGGGSEFFWFCVLVIGGVEEGCKFLALALFVSRWKAFDEPIDGIVYAAAVAIGYATFENLLFVPVLTWQEQLARALSSPITHSLFAALWGYAVGQARFGGIGSGPGLLLTIAAVALAMFLHGLYDFALLAWGASVFSALIALVLWVALILVTRRMVGRPHAEETPSSAV